MTEEQYAEIYASVAKRNPQEAVDLKKLHGQLLQAKERFSDYALSLLELDETMLKHSGYKSIEAALVSVAKDHKASLNKLTKEHFKKYPD